MTLKMESSRWCVNSLQRIAADLAVYLDGRQILVDVINANLVQLDLVYQKLLGLGELNVQNDESNPVHENTGSH